MQGLDQISDFQMFFVSRLLAVPFLKQNLTQMDNIENRYSWSFLWQSEKEVLGPHALGRNLGAPRSPKVTTKDCDLGLFLFSFSMIQYLAKASSNWQQHEMICSVVHGHLKRFFSNLFPLDKSIILILKQKKFPELNGGWRFSHLQPKKKARGNP